MVEPALFIGPWRIEAQLNRIVGPSGVEALEPRTMRVLIELVRAQPAVVSRQTLMDRVWEDCVVTEHSLTIAISDLRRVFGDDPRKPAVIETIRGVGYRLIAPVAHHPVASPEQSMPVPSLSVATGDGASDGAFTVGPTAPLHPAASPDAGSRLSSRSKVAIGGAGGLLLVLLLVAAGLWIRPGQSSIHIHRIQPLTSMAGVETSPAFSPDGQRVAYVSFPDSGDVSQIFVQQLGTETPVQFTDERGAELMPAWSPDGQYIVYLHYGANGCALHKKPSFGGPALKLIDIDCRLNGTAWSPDGRTLVLSQMDDALHSQRLFQLDLETLALTPLTTPLQSYRGDAAPRFSPDGSRLAFLRMADAGAREIFLINLDGAPPAPISLTSDAANITGFDWTSDGRAIVFASNRGGQNGLWQIAVKVNAKPVLIRAVSVEDPGSVIIARTGQALVYTDWTYEINTWTMPAAGNGAARPLLTSTRSDYQPAISSTQKIAFVSSRTGINEIWVTDEAGQQPVKLTDLQSPATQHPAWSPDGTHIAFVSRQNGRSGIYVIDAAGGRPHEITEGIGQYSRPTWGRNGKSLYFGSDRTGTWQIWKKTLASGTLDQITIHGGVTGQIRADDGSGERTLWYLRPDTTGIWAKVLPDGDEVRILDADPSFLAVSEAGLFYLHPSSEALALDVMRYDFVSGESVRVREIPLRPLHYFSRWGFTVSPAGEVIYFSQVDRSQSDLMLTEGVL